MPLTRVQSAAVANSAITSEKIADQPRTYNTTQTFSGSSSSIAVLLSDAAEVCNVTATAASGNVNIDITAQPVLFYTANATTNWTMNVRASGTTTLNSIMSNGQSITTAFLATQGTTAYFANALLIDGTSANVTTRWQGGAAPTAGNASSIDAYSLTIIKTGLYGTAGTFTVLASQTRFG